MGIGDLSKLKSFVPIVRSGVTVDDGWDQTNRVFMFSLMCIFGFIVTARSFLGNIIKCYGFQTFGSDFSEDFCWTQGLYTMKGAYDHPMSDIPYPGIIPEEARRCSPQQLVNGGISKCPDMKDVVPNERIYHLWYQWVPFYFFLMACLYFAPYIFYKNFGMAEVKIALEQVHLTVEDEDGVSKTVKKLASWMKMTFKIYMNPGSVIGIVTQRYKLAISIVITKILYLTVSIACFYFTAAMFEYGDFTTYGAKWAWTYGNDTQTTLIKDKLFPKMVACEIKRWGPTGIEEEQGMCVLAPNVVNQYLFLFVWYAMVITIICNIISVILTPISLCCSTFSYKKFRTAALLPKNPSMKALYLNVGISGRIILNLFAENTKPKIFEDLMNALIEQLKETRLLDDNETDLKM